MCPYKLAAVWLVIRTEWCSHSVWRLFFLCQITGGDARTGPETSEVAVFAEHELPANSDAKPFSGIQPLPRRYGVAHCSTRL